MKFIVRFSLICLFLALYAGDICSQGVPGPGDRLSTPPSHVSRAGGFSILLPVDVTSQRRITGGQGTTGGIQFFWRTLEGEFFVSFYDNAERSPDAKQELEQLANNYISGIVKNGGRSLEKTETSLETFPGLQIKARLKSGETVVIRYFMVEKRIFIISTRWNLKDTGEKQLYILDTFRLVSRKQ